MNSRATPGPQEPGETYDIGRVMGSVAFGYRLSWVLLWPLAAVCTSAPSVDGGVLSPWVFCYSLLVGAANMAATLQQDSLQRAIWWVNVPVSLVELFIGMLACIGFFLADAALLTPAWQMFLWGIPCTFLLFAGAVCYVGWKADHGDADKALLS